MSPARRRRCAASPSAQPARKAAATPRLLGRRQRGSSAAGDESAQIVPKHVCGKVQIARRGLPLGAENSRKQERRERRAVLSRVVPSSTALGLDSRLAAFAKEWWLRCRYAGGLRPGWRRTRDPDSTIPPGRRSPNPAADWSTSPRSSRLAVRRRLARRRIYERLSGCALRSVPSRRRGA